MQGSITAGQTNPKLTSGSNSPDKSPYQNTFHNWGTYQADGRSNDDGSSSKASGPNDYETGTIGWAGKSEEGKSDAKDNAVYEHHRNTITMQSSKVIGEFNYSFVSVSPT